MGRIIGIDLGTTNSVVSVVDAGGARILQNRENEHSTRSIVGYNKGEFLVGKVALRKWPLNTQETVISIKRLMGRGIHDSEIEKMRKSYKYGINKPSDGSDDYVCIPLGGKEYTPTDISAMLLKKLKDDAEYVLGEEVTHAVITVPAYFNDRQRHATREAGLKAGLKVMKLLDEPTAAAIAYGIESREQDAKTLLVYDLGGGTFDISVLMMGMGAYAPLNLQGDMWLGGDDFDQLIIDYVLDHIKSEYGLEPAKGSDKTSMRFMAELKIAAQEAKEALSSSSVASIILPGLLTDSMGNLIDIDIDITQSQFETMSAPLVAKAAALVMLAIKNANLTAYDIDYVLMAGNSTAMPMIQRSMEELFGREKILRKIHPKHCVAMGAAMTAVVYRGVDCPKCKHSNSDLDAEVCEKCGTSLSGAEKSKTCPKCGSGNDTNTEKCAICGSPFLSIDPENDGGCAAFSYGIQTAGDKYAVFIKKSDPYPTPPENRLVQTFHTIYPNQPSISIPVYGGDNMDRASSNERQGCAYAVLPPGCPEGTAVRIKLWLNKDGYFELSAYLDDGTDLQPKILREKDKAVAQYMDAVEAKIQEKRDFMAERDRDEINELRNEVYNAIKNDDPEEARQKAQMIEKKLDGIVPDDGLPLDPAQGLINFAMFVTNQYAWLIGAEAYTLNLRIEELRKACASGDETLKRTAMERLNGVLDSLLTSNELLASFVTIHSFILQTVQPVDPVQCANLREELFSIEQMFRDGNPDAMNKLIAFSERLGRMGGGDPDPRKIKKCHTCGHENPSSAVVCENCKVLLNIVEMGDIRTQSSGRLF